MRVGTYGLGTTVPRARNMGGGLAGQAVTEQAQATGDLAKVAQDETQRNITNQNLEQQDAAGDSQLGATAGAAAGFMYAGPWGAVAGGLIGGLLGDDIF